MSQTKHPSKHNLPNQMTKNILTLTTFTTNSNQMQIGSQPPRQFLSLLPRHPSLDPRILGLHANDDKRKRFRRHAPRLSLDVQLLQPGPPRKLHVSGHAFLLPPLRPPGGGGDLRDMTRVEPERTVGIQELHHKKLGLGFRNETRPRGVLYLPSDKGERIQETLQVLRMVFVEKGFFHGCERHLYYQSFGGCEIFQIQMHKT